MKTGRDKEVKLILQANKAVAVAQLMRGGLNDWFDFLKPRTDDLQSLPRKNLKSGHSDVKKRLSGEIQDFCNKNFIGMDERILSRLYDDINVPYGLEMPLLDFEKKYAKIKLNVSNWTPKHATIVVSLWGLQFQYPEATIAKDIAEAVRIAKNSEQELAQYTNITHSDAVDKKEAIAESRRKSDFAVRSAILSCFNLLEAYLNGIAWEFTQDETSLKSLSENTRKIIKDTSNTKLSDKIIKYPEIIKKSALWDKDNPLIKSFLNDIKPFRDSIVHPSPFTVPEKFGGYDKLQKLYSVNLGTAKETIKTTVEIIETINSHLWDDSRHIGEEEVPAHAARKHTHSLNWLRPVKAEITR